MFFFAHVEDIYTYVFITFATNNAFVILALTAPKRHSVRCFVACFIKVLLSAITELSFLRTSIEPGGGRAICDHF